MFRLQATLSDGFSVKLDGRFPSQSAASREADSYIRHYSDPCGMGVHVSSVSIIDVDLEEQERRKAVADQRREVAAMRRQK
jgi:regulator of protease activity HflC (stomatin/prohibitin superfamily)